MNTLDLMHAWGVIKELDISLETRKIIADAMLEKLEEAKAKDIQEGIEMALENEKTKEIAYEQGLGLKTLDNPFKQEVDTTADYPRN